MEKEPEGEMPDLMFDMPDFSGVGKALGLLAWLPFVLSAVSVFILVFLVQVLFYGLTQYDSAMTFGAFMLMVVASLVLALVAGIFAKFKAEKKMRAQHSGKGIL